MEQQLAVDGTGALDPGCLQYLWDGIRSSASVTFVLRQGDGKVAEVLEAPHLVTDVAHETVAVASAELAAESLGLHDPNISLNDIQQTLLQEVAQAGETGAMQNDLTKKLNIDARAMHYNVRHLQGFGLVKVQKALKSNVICLSRHYNACLCKLAGVGPTGSKLRVGATKGSSLNYAPMAERIVAALRAARDCTLVESEVRITLGMKGNAHKNAWGNIRRELEKRGAVTIRVTVNGRMQPCLHLRSSSGLATSESERKPELEGGSRRPSVSQVRAEETVKQQIYSMVIESGEEGVTHAEINRRLLVPTRTSYTICCALVAANRLCLVAETINGQCNYRLIGPAHFRAEEYAGVSTSAASPAEGDEPAKTLPRTVQQQQRLEKVQAYVNEHRMVWFPDVIHWMKSEFGDEVDKKVLSRLISELQNEGKVQTFFFSTRASLRHRERQIQAIFANGVPSDGPEVQAFVEAKAVKRRKYSAKPENAPPHMRFEVDHLPRVADYTGSRQHAAKVRIRRLELGFIEGRMARAKALHLYLWSCDMTENQQFSMESVLKDMKLRDYAQLLGITTFDLPGIDDFLAQNVKVSALPEPHCHKFINGRPPFCSFKTMLEILMKLELLSPTMKSSRCESPRTGTNDGNAPTDDSMPVDDPVGAANHSQASFTHFSLASTVHLPGHANRASTGESPTESASSHLNLGTVAQFGITSEMPRDRAYILNRDGELEQYWSDLQSFVTERAGSTQARDTDPGDAAKPNAEDIARQEGLSDLPEVFRTRSWIVEKPLSAAQRADVARIVDASDMQQPPDFKTILQIAKSTKVPLVSLVAHFNNAHQPGQVAVTSRLMPIRQRRTGASSRAANVSAAVSGGPRKSRRRQSGARSPRADPVVTGGLVHAPDHVAAYMATAQAGRRKTAASDAGQALRDEQAAGAAAEKISDDDEDRVVPRRAAKLQWSSQMDMDLAAAYIAERNRVARSEKCYRVSWAHIGVELSVPPARARRRWTVLQKDPKFKQAITMAANGSASQSSLLQLILQGGNDQPTLLDARLPVSVDVLQRSFHIRDGSSAVHWVGHIDPKLSAVMLALKAILLVPENQCERDTAISLLTRFENSDIENAIRIMKAQHLLTSVKGAKANSRAFRLSTKFHESRKLVAENYQRDIFDAMRAASADIRVKLDSEDPDSPLDDVDPVSGGGHAAVVLGQVVEGTLALSPKSSLAEEDKPIGSDEDTASSTAPHASILSHLLLVGAVQQSADSRSGSEKANLSVHLPPWKIGMRQIAAAYNVTETRDQINSGLIRRRRDSTTDWSRFELVAAQEHQTVNLPDCILEAASKSGIPRELAHGIFAEIHKSGREGATIEDIMRLIQQVGTTLRATSSVALSAAAEELVSFLAAHLCIVRVSAWDHHRYVSSLLDHVWSMPRQSGQHSPSENQDTGAETTFPYASALTSWTRIDSGVDAPLLRSLRQAIAALVMKHPGIEEETIRTRVENIHPREVQDLLQSMVNEGLLRSRGQRVRARRTSLFHAPVWETVRCYWALPKTHSGVL